MRKGTCYGLNTGHITRRTQSVNNAPKAGMQASCEKESINSKKRFKGKKLSMKIVEDKKDLLCRNEKKNI